MIQPVSRRIISKSYYEMYKSFLLFSRFDRYLVKFINWLYYIYVNILERCWIVQHMFHIKDFTKYILKNYEAV